MGDFKFTTRVLVCSSSFSSLKIDQQSRLLSTGKVLDLIESLNGMFTLFITLTTRKQKVLLSYITMGLLHKS